MHENDNYLSQAPTPETGTDPSADAANALPVPPAGHRGDPGGVAPPPGLPPPRASDALLAGTL